MSHLTRQQWSLQLHDVLKTSNQRIIVDCSGDKDWCQQLATELALSSKPLVLSHQNNSFSASLNVVPFNKSIQLLGQEFNVVIFDANDGFDVDAFARAIGLIKAPGMLVLMHPINEEWLNQHDSKNIWQDQQQGNHYFLSYLQHQLELPSVIRCQQNQPLKILSTLKLSEYTAIDAETGLSAQQQLAWDELQSIFNKNIMSMALLAARGRGKSTLLGRWLKQSALISKHFIITSDSKNAAGHCLRFVAEQDNVEYVAIDSLIENEKHADCIIVDEAATIPVALLFQLKQRYQRVIYTSTLEGYEGTGQGFELQFLASFEPQSLKRIELKAPMRWGGNDLLEKWMQVSLLHKQTSFSADFNDEEISYQQVSQKQLSEDSNLLAQIFQLLKSAHYRTQSSDLKMLLDNPSITLFVAKAECQVIGVMVLMAEGGISKALSRDIYFGKRRPQGHLLAQGLTVHAGCEGFAELIGYRVQRIAVAKPFRNKGIGSYLLQLGVEFAKHNKVDYLGAVFALDEQRLNFWHNNAMNLMMVGVGQGTSTGNPSLTMLMSLSKAASEYKETCQNNLKLTFAERLLTHFKTMPTVQIASLIRLIPSFGDADMSRCDTYIYGHKGFEYALPDLKNYVLSKLQHKASYLSEKNQSLLIKAILQYQPWPELIKAYQFSGKKEFNQKLKEALKEL